jgi:hypothetical protein
MRMNVLQKKIATGVFLLLSVILLITSRPSASVAEISVAATLSSASFSVDEGAQLTITVNGSRSADVQIPETGKFDIFQRGRSSQVNMINGEFSSSITITCLLRAYEPGSYSIPPITIIADRKTLKTEEIPFEVTTASQSSRKAAPGSGTAASPPSTGTTTDTAAAFITLSKAKERSYVGEIVPVEIKAYFRQGLRANLNSAPSLIGDGLVMPQLHDQPRQTQERVGTATYSVLTWQTTLSNIKEGRYTIHLELDATQLIPQRRTSTSLFGQRSPFDDDLFDSVFGGYKQKPIKVTSDDITLEIMPLPEEGRPDTFTGAIGNFSLHASAEPHEAEIGEPLTLTMSVRGAGNFDRVEAPSFPDSADWKTYSPSSTFTSTDNSTYAGEKQFVQAIVAKSPAISQIPSLSFSYFDPDKGVYITSSSQPINITVTGKAATVQSPVLPETPQPPQEQQPTASSETITGLAPLHLEAGKSVATILPLYRKPLFLAVMLLCLATLIVLSVLKLQQIRAQHSPEESRKRQLQKKLQDSLASIETALAQEDPTAFLTAVRSTIQAHLGTLWNCEPSAITSTNLTGRLSHADELLTIFRAAEQAAYGGARLSRETMQHYAQTLKTELEKLI